MTPNARWMQFNEDFTSVSGNGWFHHSQGVWKLDSEGRLEVESTNGTKDLAEAFRVSFSEGNMIWERTEDGMDVVVTLVSMDEFPTTYGDDLLGLWELDELNGEGDYFSDSISSPQSLFIRWDRRFVIENNMGQIHGVYHVHGHRPEVEFIPYDTKYERIRWQIGYDEDQITLTKMNTDDVVERKFKRIFEFPN